MHRKPRSWGMIIRWIHSVSYASWCASKKTSSLLSQFLVKQFFQIQLENIGSFSSMHRSTLIFLTPKTSRSLVAVQKHPCRWSGISSCIAPNGDQRWFDMRSLGQLFKNWWVNTSSRILHLVDENRLRRIMHYKNGYFCQSFTSHWGYWLFSFHWDKPRPNPQSFHPFYIRREKVQRF